MSPPSTKAKAGHPLHAAGVREDYGQRMGMAELEAVGWGRLRMEGGREEVGIEAGFSGKDLAQRGGCAAQLEALRGPEGGDAAVPN